MTKGYKPLWQCPECGERFTTANQWHSCGKFSLEPLFAGSEPHVGQLFQRFVEAVESFGPVIIIPQKTRIAFQVRMRFAAIHPRKSFLRGHFVLSRRREESFFDRIRGSGRNHVHEFRLHSNDQFDECFVDCIREAYEVGEPGRYAPPIRSTAPEASAVSIRRKAASITWRCLSAARGGPSVRPIGWGVTRVRGRRIASA